MGVAASTQSATDTATLLVGTSGVLKEAADCLARNTGVCTESGSNREETSAVSEGQGSAELRLLGRFARRQELSSPSSRVQRRQRGALESQLT